MTSDQQAQLDQLLDKYSDIFASKLTELERTNITKHTIDTRDAMPVKQHSYRASIPDQEFIRDEIGRMLEAGIIQRSNSPWASPVVIALKKNGKKRFCVDYRKVNSITTKDAYPLPQIDQMMDSLGNAKWFSSMDLTSGYWQINMDQNSKAKTAFVSREGLFEFNVMPFGLCNAPVTFQKTMDIVLGEYNWKFAMVYIDDINTYSEIFDEHLQHLQLIFEKIKAAGLKLNKEKCSFVRKTLPFLGHIISDKGITPDPSTIQKIQDFPQPRNVS